MRIAIASSIVMFVSFVPKSYSPHERTIMDIQRDATFKHLYHMLSEFAELEPVCKTAEALTLEDFSKLPNSKFANPNTREYPIHTPGHTAASALYAHKFNAPSDVKSKIAAAAVVFDIDLTCLGRTKVATETEPVYMLPSVKKYPVRNSTEFKAASDYFADFADNLKPDFRSEYAENLTKVASTYGGVANAKTLQKLGSTRTDLAMLRNTLFARSSLVKTAEAKQAYINLADSLLYKKDLSAEDQRKVAEIVNFYDKKYNVQIKGSNPGMSSVYNTTKVAEPYFTMADRRVTQSKLATIDSDILGDIVGIDVLRDLSSNGELDFSKCADILPTMPADLTRVIVRTFRL